MIGYVLLSALAALLGAESGHGQHVCSTIAPLEMSRGRSRLLLTCEDGPMVSSVPARRQEKGRGHLLDLDAPRRVVEDPDKDARDLARVQRWVMSVLAVTTIVHLVGGLVIAAVTLDGPTSSRVGLTVIAGIFGAIAVATARGIHGRRILSPWLLLGLVPTLVGLWLTLR